MMSVVLDDGQRSWMMTGSFTIGQRGDLALDDEYVSTVHARLVLDYPGVWHVEDAGSANGTFLNGVRIWGPRVLNRGDKVRVGRTTLMVVPA